MVKVITRKKCGWKDSLQYAVWRPLPNHSHSIELENFILFARRDEIFRISLDVPELIDVRLPLTNLTGAGGLDWDDGTDKIYWTDLLQDTISSANSNVSYNFSLDFRISGVVKSAVDETVFNAGLM